MQVARWAHMHRFLSVCSLYSVVCSLIYHEKQWFAMCCILNSLPIIFLHDRSLPIIVIHDSICSMVGNQWQNTVLLGKNLNVDLAFFYQGPIDWKSGVNVEKHPVVAELKLKMSMMKKMQLDVGMSPPCNLHRRAQ